MQVKICNNDMRQDSSVFGCESLRVSLDKNSWMNIKKRSSNVALAVTNQCNMSCEICYARNNRGDFRFNEMDFKTIKYILRQIGKNKKILLLGGEPTLRDDLFDIIKAVKSSGNMPLLYTNGIRLADKHYVDKLIQAGIKKIYLSIDGLDMNATVRLRGDLTCHYLKLKALDNLDKSGKIKVWLSATIAHNINEEEVKSLLDFALKHNHFIKGLIFVPCVPIGWYQIPVSAQLKAVDLINILNQATDGVLGHEYFYEFNLLRRNIDAVLNKIGKNFPLYKNSVYLNTKDGELEQFIPIEDLRKINHCLEEKRYIGLLKYIYRYNLWLFALKGLMHPVFTEVVSYKRDGLHVMIDDVKLPACELPSLAMVTITLVEWQNDIFAVITI